jgi:hypothetical protein
MPIDSAIDFALDVGQELLGFVSALLLAAAWIVGQIVGLSIQSEADRLR